MVSIKINILRGTYAMQSFISFETAMAAVKMHGDLFVSFYSFVEFSLPKIYRWDSNTQLVIHADSNTQ